MSKIEGNIKINDGFLVDHYYKFSRTDSDDHSEEVRLKYLAFKYGEHIFIDEEELLLVRLDEHKHFKERSGDYVYENLESINWLNWYVEQKSESAPMTFVVSRGGRSIETTLSLDYEVKRLAKELGVNL